MNTNKQNAQVYFMFISTCFKIILVNVYAMCINVIIMSECVCRERSFLVYFAHLYSNKCYIEAIMVHSIERTLLACTQYMKCQCTHSRYITCLF